MDRERDEVALRQSVELSKQKLTLMMVDLPEGASVPSDDLMNAMVELDDLENQLESLRDDSSNFEESGPFVCTPLKPPPHLNSGAIPLPDPEEPTV
jgi:hypothetical protein